MLSKLKDLLVKAVKDEIRKDIAPTINSVADKVTQGVSSVDTLAASTEPAAKDQQATACQVQPGEVANKIVHAIKHNFSGYCVETDVPVRRFDPNAHEKAKPVSVLVSQDGREVLAIAVVRANTYKSMPVIGTKRIIEDKGITYIRFFEEFPNETDYIVERLNSYLT